MSASDSWISSRDPRLTDRIREIGSPKVRGFAFAGDPTVLWSGLRVGVIGSRTARGDTLAIAKRISGDLAAAGVTIVSGLARGVDAAAHQAALDAGGRTIAVLGSGLGNTYPVRNRDMAAQISGTARTQLGIVAGVSSIARGAVISEYGAGEEPAYPGRFPARNRIIAALSDYLVIVQAELRSGSMSTAHAALELGVPIGVGPVDGESRAFQGALSLIRDGADTVVDGASVAHRLELHRVGPPGFGAAFRAGARIEPDGTIVIPDPHEREHAARSRLADDPIGSFLDVPRTEEDLAELAGFELRPVRRTLLELEAAGLVAATPDGQWIATP